MAYYVQLDADYWDHPKTLVLVEMLGPTADVYPPRLWSWCAKYRKNGVMASIAQIAHACRWAGDPKQLADGLYAAGFLESDLLTLHDWMDRSGGDIAVYEGKKRRMREKYHQSKDSNVSLSEEVRKPSSNIPPIGTERIGTERKGSDRIGTAPAPPPLKAAVGAARSRIGTGTKLFQGEPPTKPREIAEWLGKCQWPTRVTVFLNGIEPQLAKDILSELDAMKANGTTPVKFLQLLRERATQVV